MIGGLNLYTATIHQLNLDAVTLIWIHVALTGSLGIALLLVTAIRPGTRLLRATGAAMIAISVANAGFAFRHAIPDPGSILLSTGLMLLAGLVMHQSVTGFVLRSRARPDYTGWLVALFTLAWVGWFTFVKPDLIARITLMLPVAAFFIGRVAWHFGVYSRGERGTPLSDVLTGLLWFFSFMALLTGILTAAGINPIIDLRSPGPASMTYLATRIAVIAAIVLMIAAIDLRAARGPKRRATKAADSRAAAPLSSDGQIAVIAARAISRADPKRRPLSVVVIELDNIKHVTAEHGQEVARDLLAWAGQRIQWSLRAQDTAELVGLDDYAILMPGTDAQQAISRAEQMREAIAHGVCRVRGLTLNTSASAGVAGFAPGRATWEELLRTARAGMNRSRDELRTKRDSLVHPVSGLRYRARA